MVEGIWVKVGNFSRFHIMALEDRRRLIDPETGEVYREYTIPEPNGNELPETIASTVTIKLDENVPD